jgi:hypothetical protein
MNKIYLIADVSGSFAEMDKKLIQVSLLQTIGCLSKTPDYSEYEIEYYAWNDMVERLSSFDLTVGGQAKLDALASFIDSTDVGSRLLILTDGNFIKLRELDILKKKAEKRQTFICFVAVGADANVSALKRMTSKVFLAVDTVHALNEVYFGGKNTESLPAYVKDIIW